jgi:ankyrin repeat protein
MKHLLLTTIAAVVLVGCGESQQSSEAKPVEPVPEAAQPLRDAKAPNTQANRALGNAAFVGDIEDVKQHLTASSDVNKRDEEGATPLHYAVSEGHQEIVKLLIKKGADVHAKDKDGWIPLLYATAEGQEEVVDLLIAAGTDVNTKDGDGDTSLDWAIMRNHTETAALLRKHGGKTGAELKAEGK